MRYAGWSATARQCASTSPSGACASTDIQRRRAFTRLTPSLLRGEPLGGFVEVADYLVLAVVGRHEATEPGSDLLEGVRITRAHGRQRLLDRRLEARRQVLADDDRIIGDDLRDPDDPQRAPGHLVLARELLEIGQVGRRDLDLLGGYRQDRC